jgi:hypothetical protein
LIAVQGFGCTGGWYRQGASIGNITTDVTPFVLLQRPRLPKTLPSNCTFDRGNVCLTYNKLFDLFVKGCRTGEWLLRLDSNQQPSVNSSGPADPPSVTDGDEDPTTQ